MAIMYVAMRNDLYVDAPINDDPIYDCGARLIGVFEDYISACRAAEEEAELMFESMINSDKVKTYDYIMYNRDYEGAIYVIRMVFQNKKEYIRYDYTIQCTKEES